MQPKRAGEVEALPGPVCPECGNEMSQYGGSAGWICCNFKLLYRASGWFENGLHVADDRLAGGRRRVDGEVRER